MEEGDLECHKWMLKRCDQSLNLEFTDLSYTLSGKKGQTQKLILRSINGKFSSGKLTAILGPSGAGKSSLLNILSGYKTSGVNGSITINGRPRSLQEFRRQSCYIEQEFALLPLLTTRETLEVAADLKLGTKVNCYRKSTMVTEILDLLGLLKASDTLVQLLSGGEKKRLSIGLELLTNPPVMFFDEPTSGLDCSSSVQVVSHLKSLAAEGRTIICVIHQPNSRLFDMFDDVFVLAEGHCIYNGPTSGIVETFEASGFQCPKYYNPADFVVEVASRDRDGPLEVLIERQRLSHISTYESVSPSHKHGELSNGHLPSGNKGFSKYSDMPVPEYAVGTFAQFLILLKRSLRCTFRDIYLAKFRVLMHVTMPLLLGCVFFQIGNDAAKVSSNVSAIFFFLMFFFFGNSLLTVLSFPVESAVVLREHHNNWYSLNAYYFSRLLSDLPLQLLCPTLFVLIAYFMTGQPIEAERICLFWLMCMMMVTVGQSSGLAIGAGLSSQMAVFVVGTTPVPLMLFSGFFLRINDMNTIFRWISDISFFRRGFEAGMLSVYGYNRTKLACSIPYCHFRSPEKLLEDVGMENNSFIVDIIILLIWIIAFHLTFYFILRWRLRLSR